MRPFFSIIVPVYNVEEYLENCLDSIFKQDFSSFELICIDDGSTDRSLNILNDYKNKYTQIRIKSIENKGTANARNEGINLAIGRYLLFIDSDDWIEKNSLGTLYKYLENNAVDILSFNGYLYFENEKTVISDHGLSIKSINGWDYYNRQVLRPRKFHFVCVVIRAYNKSFIIENELFFEPETLHEDNLFTPQAFYYAKKVAEIPDPLYFYRIRQGSKMHEYSYRQISDKCEVNNRLGDFFFSKADIDLSHISRVIASDYINLFGTRVKSAIGSKQKEIISQINGEYFRRSCLTKRHRFLYRLIRINPSLYRAYMGIINILH